MWTDALVAVSSAVIAFAAIYGLCTWRKEMTGKVRFDIARNVALLALRVNENFSRARFPISSSSEAIGRSKGASESANEAQVLDEWYIRNSRLEMLRETLSKLQAAGWEAEVVLGKGAGQSVTEAIATFRACFGELASSIDSYFEITMKQAKVNTERLSDLRKTIYSAGGDDLSVRVEQTKNEMISVLNTYLR